MQRVERAIIIRRIAYGEADWIVTLFCRGCGRMSGIARSARSSMKRFGGALEPGTQVEVRFSGRPGASLARVDEARVIRSANGVVRSLERIAAMARALDLALAFLQEGQPAPEKFDLLEERLSEISERDPGVSDTVDFELRWLCLSGFAPQLGRCCLCEATSAGGGSRRGGAAWAFDVDRGGIVCPACSAGQKRRVRLSDGALRFLSRPSVDQGGDDSARAAAAILARYIDHVVGRPLASWKVPVTAPASPGRGDG